MILSQHEHDCEEYVGDSYIAGLVREETHRNRSLRLTVSKIGNGGTTSFWHDHWLLSSTLAEIFPVLYSHSVRQSISVSDHLMPCVEVCL
jgi:hypothetical protein